MSQLLERSKVLGSTRKLVSRPRRLTALTVLLIHSGVLLCCIEQGILRCTYNVECSQGKIHNASEQFRNQSPWFVVARTFYSSTRGKGEVDLWIWGQPSITIQISRQLRQCSKTLSPFKTKQNTKKKETMSSIESLKN